MRLHFRFVGGPHDGKTLPVPSPIKPGMELYVRREEPYLPGARYVLEPDGVFRFAPEGMTGPSAAADESVCTNRE